MGESQHFETYAQMRERLRSLMDSCSVTSVRLQAVQVKLALQHEDAVRIHREYWRQQSDGRIVIFKAADFTRSGSK